MHSSRMRTACSLTCPGGWGGVGGVCFWFRGVSAFGRGVWPIACWDTNPSQWTESQTRVKT